MLVRGLIDEDAHLSIGEVEIADNEITCGTMKTLAYTQCVQGKVHQLTAEEVTSLPYTDTGSKRHKVPAAWTGQHAEILARLIRLFSFLPGRFQGAWEYQLCLRAPVLSARILCNLARHLVFQQYRLRRRCR